MGCANCSDCPPTPAPVMPRCDVTLPDGTYSNATVVVEDGCIVGVQAGALPVYTPDICCPDGSGGGGGEGLDGPPGPPGENATIAIGTVSTVAFGQPATVTNSGTNTNAILDFEIPRGEPGEDSPDADGLTIDVADIEFENGLLKGVPAQWPPIMLVNATPVSTPGVTLTAVKDPATGIVTIALDMSAFVTDLTDGFQEALDNVNTIMRAMETQIVSLQEAVLACCPSATLDLNGDGTDDPVPPGVPGSIPPPPIPPN